jgi:hypothetical protein
MANHRTRKLRPTFGRGQSQTRELTSRSSEKMDMFTSRNTLPDSAKHTTFQTLTAGDMATLVPSPPGLQPALCHRPVSLHASPSRVYRASRSKDDNRVYKTQSHPARPESIQHQVIPHTYQVYSTQSYLKYAAPSHSVIPGCHLRASGRRRPGPSCRPRPACPGH